MSPVVLVRQGSLTDGDEDVLVNASNTNVALGSGVSAAIAKACGPGYQEHIKQALDARFGGPMPPAEVLVTDAGAHPRAKWVAHVAVMDYRPGAPAGTTPSRGRIREACEKLWRALEAIDSPSPLGVAMVALGAGVGGLGVRAPTEEACDTLRAHLAVTPGSWIGKVVFYGYALHEFIAVKEVVHEKLHEHRGHD
jgi:O-acetyl-ADP-ribose deacetylase (regulator of RNase III)